VLELYLIIEYWRVLFSDQTVLFTVFVSILSIGIVTHRLEYEQRKDHDGPIRKMSDTLSALKAELVKVESRETQVKAEMEELSGQVEKLREDMAELKSKVEGVEEEIQELKKRGSSDTSSLGNVKRQMTAKVETQVHSP